MRGLKPGVLAALTGACLAIPLDWTPVHSPTSFPAVVRSRQPEPPKKIALIVAIGTYAPATGWGRLATENDAQLLRAALARQGFSDSDIHTLQDDKATAPAIVAAFRNELIARAGPGTIAVFHYSGHGHRLTDNNGDEPDGYDEVLVPHDAPRRPPATYTGEKHVRDDAINDLVRELRRRVGNGGDVIVSLDSCYSGSAARAAFAGAEARGDILPIGPPQAGRNGRDEASGFEEAGADVASPAASLAPYVVLSAARHDELAWETISRDNRAVGALSLALSQALTRAGTRTTYRTLFDDVQRTMSALVVNTPQIEGEADREILGGQAVVQEPFYTIASIDAPGRVARLRHGTLAGLLVGTRVAVHPAGTAQPRPEAALAVGIVTEAGPTNALVEFDHVVDPAAIPAGWVFVTEASFGSLKAVVRIESAAGAPWAAGVRAALATQRFISVGDASPDYVVVEDPPGSGRVSLRAGSDGRTLLGPLDPRLVDVPAAVARRVRDATRNRYLRDLSMSAPAVAATVEILPCEVSCRAEAGVTRCDCVRDLAPGLVRPAGGGMTLAVGDGFRIRLRNRGTGPVYVSVLDLEANGSISLLWPAWEHQGQDNRLARDANFLVAQPWRITPPAGVEVFKLFASLEQIDFRPITSRDPPKVQPRGPFDTLFIDAFEGARAEPTLPVSAVHTQDITVRIVDNRTP